MCTMAPAELDLLTADRPATDGAGTPGAARAGVTPALATVQTVLARFLTELDGTGPGPGTPEHLTLERIEPDRSLTDYATNSVQMLQLHARLEDAFGVEISASALFDHHTVAALADHLARRA
jgi:acyl carrier protein